MYTLMRGLICLTACLSLGTAFAEDFDGSRPLICAPTEAVDLRPGEQIVKARPSDIGAPSFLRLDIANKKILGEKRVTPINYVEKTGQQITLQGTELGFGWTLVLDRQSGAMTLTFADLTGAVVLSGMCTPI